MHTNNPIAHYQADAVVFDYFETETPLEADGSRRLREAVLESADLSSPPLVVDLGSGMGWSSAPIRRTGARYLAVDLSLSNLRRIRSRDGHEVLAVVADATRLPFRPGSVPAVVMTEVLEHINVPAQAVREVASALSAGGIFMLSTPYREVLRYTLCIHCNTKTPLNAHLHSFDRDDHRRLLEDAGFISIHHRLLQDRFFLRSRLSWLLRFLPFQVWSWVDTIFQALFHHPLHLITRAHHP